MADPHPVLGNPDVLDTVVLYLRSLSETKRDMDAAGLVCKTWRECMLAVRWRDVTLMDLLAVLGRLVIVEAAEEGDIIQETRYVSSEYAFGVTCS